MAEPRGPITLVNSISDQRNRWKDLAYAWKGVALQAVRTCSECGEPALWRDSESTVYWCERHWKLAPPDAAEAAEKVAWYVALLRAFDLEDQL